MLSAVSSPSRGLVFAFNMRQRRIRAAGCMGGDCMGARTTSPVLKLACGFAPQFSFCTGRKRRFATNDAIKGECAGRNRAVPPDGAGRGRFKFGCGGKGMLRALDFCRVGRTGKVNILGTSKARACGLSKRRHGEKVRFSATNDVKRG